MASNQQEDISQVIEDQEQLIQDQQQIINTAKQIEFELRENLKNIQKQKEYLETQTVEIKKKHDQIQFDFEDQQQFYHKHVQQQDQEIKKLSQENSQQKFIVKQRNEEIQIQSEQIYRLTLELNQLKQQFISNTISSNSGIKNNSQIKGSDEDKQKQDKDFVEEIVFEKQISQDSMDQQQQHQKQKTNEKDTIQSDNSNNLKKEEEGEDNNINIEKEIHIQKIYKDFEDQNIQEILNMDELTFQNLQQRATKMQNIFVELKAQDKQLTKREVTQIVMENISQSQYKNLTKKDIKPAEEFNEFKLERSWEQDILPLFEDQRLNKDSILNKSKQFILKKKLAEKFRGQTWKFLVGNNLSINNKFYDKLFASLEKNPLNLEKNRFTIKVDLSRTSKLINEMDEQKQEKLKADLQELLIGISIFRPDIGYVQGMAYYAFMFLIRMTKQDAFQSLANLLVKSDFLQTMFRFDNPRMDAYFNYFDKLLLKQLPQVHKHLTELEIQKVPFLIEWSFTFFSRAFNLQVVAKLWDYFIAFGDTVFFRIAISILQCVQQEILKTQNYENCMVLINNCTYLVGEDDLFKAFDKFKIPTDKFEQGVDKEEQILIKLALEQGGKYPNLLI